MKRMLMFVVALVVAGVMVSNGPLAAAAQRGYWFDFNKSLAPFAAYPSAAPSDATDALTLALSYSCYTSVSSTAGGVVDNGCARVTLDLDASFVSLLAQLKGQGITINVEFDARDLDGRGAAAAMVYAGSGKPIGAGSFQQVGPLLSQTWTHYGYRALLDGNDPVVAVGITRVGDGPNRVQHAGIDNVRVTFLND
jgi:hypothetical protein